MSIKEKVAYLKGLAEGLGLDSDVKSEKLIAVMIDTMDEMADEIESLSANSLDIGDELDALSDDLADVEEFLFGDEDDDDYDEFDFDDDEDDGCGCGFCGGSALSYEVACPACSTEIELEESDLLLDSIACPKCGEILEFDFDDEFDDEDFEDEDFDLVDDDSSTKTESK
ncbi:MAG: hypothetical protein FWB75_00850 [Oscillospiraceae bacterium]|nr:hypothetical protein [Oscillospiraceae bacterium]